MIQLICTLSSEFKLCFNVLLLKSAFQWIRNAYLLLTSSNHLLTVAALHSPSRTANLCSMLSCVYPSYLSESQLQCDQQFMFYAKASCTFPIRLLFSMKCCQLLPCTRLTTVTTMTGVIYYLSLAERMTLTALKQTKSSTTVNSWGSTEVNNADLNHLAFHPYKPQPLICNSSLTLAKAMLGSVQCNHS